MILGAVKKLFRLFSGLLLPFVCSLAFGQSYTLTAIPTTGGSISSSPSGINNCTTTTGCSASLSGTVVLTATPSSNYAFSGWWGAGCSGTSTCSITLSAATTVLGVFEKIYPSQPNVFVDNHRADCKANGGCYPGSPGWNYLPAVAELNIVTGTVVHGTLPTGSGCAWHAPYAQTLAGFQQAVNDDDCMRAANGGNACVTLDVAAAFDYTTSNANALVFPMAESTLPNCFIIIQSTLQASLPSKEPVCRHGNDPNLSTSKHPGIENRDCTGGNMYFELGPTNSSGLISGVTTVSVNTTTLAAITGSGSPQLVALQHGYVSPTLGGSSSSVITIDTGANQETVTPVSGANQTGIYAVFSKNHSSGACVVYNYVGCGGTITNGTGAFTLANGTATNTANYNDLQYMYTIESSNTAGLPVQTCSPLGSSGTSSPPWCNGGAQTSIGAAMYVLKGAEIRFPSGLVNVGNYLVSFGQTGTETAATQWASMIDLSQDFLHGDWTSLNSGANAISAGILMYGTSFSLMYSQISQILRPGVECHTITQQADQVKIDDNVLELCSSSVFSGGFSTANGPSVFGWVPMVDVEMRRNWSRRPYAWLGQSPITTNPNYSTFSTVFKNFYESKSSERVVLAGNTFANGDNSGAQSCLTVVQQDLNRSAGGMGRNYQATINDISFIANEFDNACNAMSTARSTSSISNGDGGVAHSLQNFYLYQNFWSGLSLTGPGSAGASNETFSFTSLGGQSWQGTITTNGAGIATFVAYCENEQGNILGTGGTCMGQILSLAGSGGSACTAGNLTFSGGSQQTNGVPATGTYTCSGSALGTVTLTNPGTGYLSAPTVGFSATCTGCSVTPTMVSSTATNIGAGWEVMNIDQGDPLWILNCTGVTGYNTPTSSYGGTILPSGTGVRASAGSAAWTGTFNAAGVTVSFPTSTTGSDTAGYCTVTNVQGGPHGMILRHNTVLSSNSTMITSNNTRNSGGPNFQINAAWLDNLLVGGAWDNSDRGVGTPSEVFNYDVNSLTASTDVFPGQTSSSYTAYGANPGFPIGSPSLLFPTNTCGVGFGGTGTWAYGTCSGNAVPITAADPHDYELNSSSSYHNAASDGTDIGSSITAIDTERDRNLWVCTTPYGSVGPFPDAPLNTVFVGGSIQ